MKIRQTSYLRKALMPGEQALVEARLHSFRYLNACFLALLGIGLLALSILLPLLLIGAPICLLAAWISWLRVSCTQMLVTNKRVIFKEGIFSVHTEEIRNAKVESVEITQSITGRLLGYATIHFAGTGNSDVYFLDVADPWKVKNMAEAIVNEDYPLSSES